jgi:hypothetical protein
MEKLITAFSVHQMELGIFNHQLMDLTPYNSATPLTKSLLPITMVTAEPTLPFIETELGICNALLMDSQRFNLVWQAIFLFRLILTATEKQNLPFIVRQTEPGMC